MIEKKENMTPKVSVIVSVYNAELFLDKCVESILAQQYSEIELILVDDGSPDRCPAVCDAYAERDSRVRVIHKENGGAQLARKDGLDEADGAYVLFVDSDDWIDPDTVESCVETALSDNADCVMFGYVREYPNKSIANPLFDSDRSFDSEESEAFVHRRIAGPIREELSQPQRVDNLSSVCMKLYRTETARKGRIVSERVVGTSEDTIFNLYALDGCRISYINRCFYHYRKSNSKSITTAYKPELSEKWDVMYGVIQEYMDGLENPEMYRTAFFNRVACGLIGLGLNEICSEDAFCEKSHLLKNILCKPLYETALSQLDISHCGLKWKVFFLLCKQKATLFLTLLLKIMNYLRSRAAS